MSTDDATTALQKALAARGVPIDQAGEILAGTNPDAFVDAGAVDQAALDRFADIAAGGPARRSDYGGGRPIPDPVGSRNDGHAEAVKRFGIPEPPTPTARGGFGALGHAEAVKRFGNATTSTGGRGSDRSGTAAAGSTLGPTPDEIDSRTPPTEAQKARLKRSLSSDTLGRAIRRRR